MAKAKLALGGQMRSRATPSLNDTSAPRGCCRAIPSLSSAGLCTAFPKALVGRAAGAGSSRRRQGLGLALPVQVEGGDLGVVPLEVHKVEKVLGSLLLTFLPGRKQGVSLTKLLGSLDTEWWHKDSAPRDTGGLGDSCCVATPVPKVLSAELEPSPAVPGSSTCTLVVPGG